MAFDLVIRNGTVVDGTGLAPYRADVGVTGTRITEIGRITTRAKREIDAEGHVVTPGFIDGHTHMDAQIFWDPLGSCSCFQGVTSVVMGNCGFTLAPVRPDARELVVRNLERAEDIPRAALAAGITWSWEHFSEYLDAIEALPKGINYAAQIGHSALRTWAMGERAFEETATDDDLKAMETELQDALGSGAFGFTTSRNFNHETSDGRPVASRLADWHEIQRLIGAMAEVGSGVFEMTLEAAAYSDDVAIREEFFGRLRALAHSSGIPFTFGVRATRPDWRVLLELIESTNTSGGRMFGQSHSRGLSLILSFRTQLPFDNLPVWRELRARPINEQAAALRDPALRAKLVESADHGDYGSPIGGEARRPNYGEITALFSPVPPNPTVLELATEHGRHPVDEMIELALEHDLSQMFVQPVHTYALEDLRSVMKHPCTVMTFSDSGAHVSQMIDSSIQTHLLAYWVRDRQDFTLEEAIRMITLEPSVAWGLADRGLVREGFRADLNVFDPERVAPTMPELVFDLPGGARRLVQRASGFRATVVAGEPLLIEGEHTGALPGQLLRGRAPRF